MRNKFTKYEIISCGNYLGKRPRNFTMAESTFANLCKISHLWGMSNSDVLAYLVWEKSASLFGNADVKVTVKPVD